MILLLINLKFLLHQRNIHMPFGSDGHLQVLSSSVINNHGMQLLVSQLIRIIPIFKKEIAFLLYGQEMGIIISLHIQNTTIIFTLILIMVHTWKEFGILSTLLINQDQQKHTYGLQPQKCRKSPFNQTIFRFKTISTLSFKRNLIAPYLMGITR